MIQRLSPAQFGQIRLLHRRRLELPASLIGVNNLSGIPGSLEEPSSYSAAVTDRTIVVHLAAQTGSAPAREHDRLNRQATESLLEVAFAAGAVGFLHVSTIAVGFDRRRGYPYAEAKARAEDAVRRGGVPHTIVRPTSAWRLPRPRLYSVVVTSLTATRLRCHQPSSTASNRCQPWGLSPVTSPRAFLQRSGEDRNTLHRL